MSPLGQLIHARRKRAGLSQRELGALLTSDDKPQGVWGTYVGQIEQGKRVPPDDTVIQLAQILELDPELAVAAAYASRASTEQGRTIFGLAPLLLPLMASRSASSAPDDASLGPTLQLVLRALRSPARDRLERLLSVDVGRDEKSWHVLRNFVLALGHGPQQEADPGVPGPTEDHSSSPSSPSASSSS